MTLRIGIDLDNTILEYRDVFRSIAVEKAWVEADCPPEKALIKQQLARIAGNTDSGEERWQILQSLVYGSRIDQAVIPEGFGDFIRDMRSQCHQIFIVSHKSETSHINPRVRLREHALRTLEQRGFFQTTESGGLGFSPDHVFFESTRKTKVERLTALHLTHFIDDMVLVLNHGAFPRITQPLLIGDESDPNLPSFNGWREIHDYFSMFPALMQANPARLKTWISIRRGGNNRLAHCSFHAGPDLVAKKFLEDPGDTRPRRQQEYRFLECLWNRGIHCIPKPLETMEGANILSMIKGRTIDDADFPETGQMSDFLIALDHTGRNLEDRSTIGPAADARFSIQDHLSGIEKRFRAICDACKGLPERQPILAFLEGNLSRLKARVSSRFEAVCSQTGIDPHVALQEPLWFLSPSDFGAHNCLINDQNQVMFLDFEYAGWDDPCKLLCDFLRHVGNHLSPARRLGVIRTFVKSRHDDPTLWDRFRAVADPNAVEWILIVLNVVVRHETRRKQFAGVDHDAETLIHQRFQRAVTLCDQFWSIEELIEGDT